jgi:WD domain, G-beta repeat
VCGYQAGGADPRQCLLGFAGSILSGRLVATLKGHAHFVNAVTISPDSRLIISGSSDQKIKVWNAATGQLINTLSGHKQAVRSSRLLLTDTSTFGAWIRANWSGQFPQRRPSSNRHDSIDQRPDPGISRQVYEACPEHQPPHGAREPESPSTESEIAHLICCGVSGGDWLNP